MITYVKGQYVNDYTVLYKEAVKGLKEYFDSLTHEQLTTLGYQEKPTEFTITNLAEYFSYMKHLTAIDVDKNELKFTKLPLDEENFKIDLNTRTITVPEAFKKNGIGVRGDNVAEIVFFEVDRYYDATDLNEQDIIIEWVNADGQKGYSRPYGKDVDLIPGKIVFGWPVSSKVTPKDGNVKFAVRFYRAEDTSGTSGITFSLSTLVQTIKVNMDIDILLEDILNKKDYIMKDDSIDVIKARAKNSEHANHGTPGTPVIFYIGEDIGDYAGDGITRPEGAPLATVVYISTDPENPTGSVNVSAGVYVDGDGLTLGSFWSKYKYFADGAIREVLREDEYAQMTDEERKAYDENFMLETAWPQYEEIAIADAKAEIRARNDKAEELGVESIPGIIYYNKIAAPEGGVEGYEVLSLSEILAMQDDAAPVYRIDFTATITSVGIYQFVAQVNAGANEKQVKSEFILVFPPVKPKKVRVESPAKKLQEDPEDHLYKVTLTAGMDDFGTELDEDILPPSFVEYNEKKDSLYPFDGSQEWASYKWYFNPNVKSAAEELKAEEWTDDGFAATKDIIATREGYYKCGIVGHLNNSASEEVISEPYRITMPPSKFSVTISGQDAYGTEIAAVTDLNIADDAKPNLQTAIQYNAEDGSLKGLMVTPDLVDERYMDKFTYEWYQYVWNQEEGKDLSVDREDAVKAMKGVYEPDEKGSINWPADLLQVGATTNEFIPEKNGIYFCIITNTYNEDVEVMCSPFMIFNRNDQ